MSIEFWKFIKQRYEQIWLKICIPQWCGTIATWLDVPDWLLAKNVWFAVAFQGVYMVLSGMIFVWIFLSLYSIYKVNRWHRAEHRRRMEELDRQMEERWDALDRRLEEEERMNA
jgi:hypothetical protein